MVNEMLRTKSKIVVIVQRDTTRVLNIMFALRSDKEADNTSAFQRQTGRKPNTLKSVVIKNCVLEKDP